MTATVRGDDRAAQGRGPAVQLGKEQLGPGAEVPARAEVEILTAEIARLEEVDADVASSVLQRVPGARRRAPLLRPGRPAYAQEVLVATLGPDKAREVLARLKAVSSRCRSSSCAGPSPPDGAVVPAGRAPADHHPRPRAHGGRAGRGGPQRPAPSRSRPTSPTASPSWTGPRPTSSSRSSPTCSGGCPRCCSPTSPRRSAACSPWSTSSTTATAAPSGSSWRGSSSAAASSPRRCGRDVHVRGHRQLEDRAVQVLLRRVDTKDLAVALKGVRRTCARSSSRTCPSGPASSSRTSTCSARCGSSRSRRRRPRSSAGHPRARGVRRASSSPGEPAMTSSS